MDKSPKIVYVLPVPVTPYARAVELYPCNTLSIISFIDSLNTSLLFDDSVKILSKTNTLLFLFLCAFISSKYKILFSILIIFSNISFLEFLGDIFFDKFELFLLIIKSFGKNGLILT